MESKTQGPSGAIIGARTGMLWAIAAGISSFAIERSQLTSADFDLMYASVDSVLLLPGVFYAIWGLVFGAIAGRLTDRTIASDTNASLGRATMIGIAKFSIFSTLAILCAVLFALLRGNAIVSAMSWYTWITWLTWSLVGAMTGAMLSPSEADRPPG